MLGSAPDHSALAARFFRERQLRIYLDDLDRGWEGQLRDIRGISALLNALRDLTNDNPGLQFRLGLRSDVYFLVLHPMNPQIKLKPLLFGFHGRTTKFLP